MGWGSGGQCGTLGGMWSDAQEPPEPDLEAPPPIEPPRPTDLERTVAFLEVLLCSDYPTQLALSTTLAALGYRPYVNGHLRVGFVVTLSIVDTAVLIALMLIFLSAHGERPRDLFLGPRPVLRELRKGLLLVPFAFAIAAGMLVLLARLAPSLHTVKNNPIEELLRSPRDAGLFAVVVVVAGGVREELQRAFLLRRFEVWLGGASIGIVVTSLAFGLGHLIQGVDAAVATGALGAFWGLVYVRRRSTVAPMVSHAGFDLLQIVQFVAFGR